jgi:serine protease Do
MLLRSAHLAAFALFLASAFLTPLTALAQSEAENLSARFRTAARRVLPAVVTVRAVATSAQPRIPAPASPGDADRRIQGGSGVVIDAEKGLILTNDHVINGSPRAVVTLSDGRERTASEIRRDPKSDLALLTIAPGGLTQAEWGDSDVLDLGDWVLAIGQPFGLADSVTAGIVSGKGRGMGLATYEDLIQTDAAINPGNSGGPLVNLKGEVVGINTAIKTLGGGYEGVGFAVPSSRARRVATDLARYGYVKRSSIHVLIARVDPATAERIGKPGAVAITSVAPLGPAADAGLKVGDVIVQVGDQPARGVGMLQSAIEVAPVGEPLRLTIVRDGLPMQVDVRPVSAPDQPRRIDSAVPHLGSAPPAATQPTPKAASQAASPTHFPDLGLRVSEPTADLAREYGFEKPPKGLFIRDVAPDGVADRGGLQVGMVITDVGGTKTESLDEFRSALAKREAGRDLVIRILKGQKAEFRVILNESTTRPAATAETNPRTKLP